MPVGFNGLMIGLLYLLIYVSFVTIQHLLYFHLISQLDSSFFNFNELLVFILGGFHATEFSVLVEFPCGILLI